MPAVHVLRDAGDERCRNGHWIPRVWGNVLQHRIVRERRAGDEQLVHDGLDGDDGVRGRCGLPEAAVSTFVQRRDVQGERWCKRVLPATGLEHDDDHNVQRPDCRDRGVRGADEHEHAGVLWARRVLVRVAGVQRGAAPGHVPADVGGDVARAVPPRQPNAVLRGVPAWTAVVRQVVCGGSPVVQRLAGAADAGLHVLLDARDTDKRRCRVTGAERRGQRVRVPLLLVAERRDACGVRAGPGEAERDHAAVCALHAVADDALLPRNVLGRDDEEPARNGLRDLHQDECDAAGGVGHHADSGARVCLGGRDGDGDRRVLRQLGHREHLRALPGVRAGEHVPDVRDVAWVWLPAVLVDAAGHHDARWQQHDGGDLLQAERDWQCGERVRDGGEPAGCTERVQSGRRDGVRRRVLCSDIGPDGGGPPLWMAG